MDLIAPFEAADQAVALALVVSLKAVGDVSTDGLFASLFNSDVVRWLRCIRLL